MNLSDMQNNKLVKVAVVAVAVLLLGFGLWAVLDASDNSPEWLPAFPGSVDADTSAEGDTGNVDGTPAKAVATATPAANGDTGSTDDNGAKSSSPAPTPGTDDPNEGNGTTTQPAATMSLMILLWNDTQSKAPEGIEVAVGAAKWAPADSSLANQTGVLKGIAVGQKLQLEVYPDGRSGKKILVPILLTKEMRSGSEADAVHVEVKDGTVRVLGTPVENFDVSVER